jgi:hypothetical protein
MRPGDVLAGRYHLADLMSEARGGQFWYAHDNVLDRHVAVHVISDEDDRADQLMAAARRSAALHDQRLLRVLDADVLDGHCFVVNEWGEGTSLDVMLLEQPLPPRRAAWIVGEVGGMIAHAHDAGVAHGRLVPENVLVDRTGAVKVIGFGVDAALHGLPVGTPEIDLADLTGVLYAALTGRWAGRSSSEVPSAPTESGRPLRPRQVRAGVPRPLDALCGEVLRSSLNGHPGYPSVRAVVDALTDFLGDPAVVAAEEAERQRNGPRRRRPRPDDTGTLPALPPVPPGAPPAPVPPVPPAPDPADEQKGQDTQVGVPVFYDDLDDVGWASPSGTTPPPPPPFEEPAERPLFAPDPPGGRAHRAHPDAVGHETGTHGSDGFWPWGTGGVPPVIEEDAEPEPESVPGRSWMRVAIVLGLGLLLLVAVIFAVNRGRDSNPLAGGEGQPSESPATSTAAEPQAVEVAAVDDFDPFGDPPEENPEDAANVLDGDPTTTWRTSTYRQDLGPEGLKEGVGLMLDLGREHDLREVTVTLVGTPTELRLLTATGDQAPSAVGDLEQAAEQRANGPTVTLAPGEPVTARWVVLWLTALPPVDGGFRGQVAEVVVRA